MIEKVANSKPDGSVKMAQDVFEETSWEERCKIDAMQDGRPKLEASLHFAEYCWLHNESDTAYSYYAYILKHTIQDNKIISKYKDLAEAAYQGLIRVQHDDDEMAWESSSGLLERYRELFE